MQRARSARDCPRQAEWTRPAGGLFIWATLPDFIDTTDLLARALRENVAFVPGEAAFLDGRGFTPLGATTSRPREMGELASSHCDRVNLCRNRRRLGSTPRTGWLLVAAGALLLVAGASAGVMLARRRTLSEGT